MCSYCYHCNFKLVDQIHIVNYVDSNMLIEKIAVVLNQIFKYAIFHYVPLMISTQIFFFYILFILTKIVLEIGVQTPVWVMLYFTNLSVFQEI